MLETDTETTLPPTWQTLLDGANEQGLTITVRRDKWANYANENFRALVKEYQEHVVEIDAAMSVPWPPGLKRSATDLMAAVRLDVKRRKEASTATAIAALERQISIVSPVWDALHDGHPPSEYATVETLQSLRVPPHYTLSATGGVRRLAVDRDTADINEVVVAPAPIFPVSRSVDSVSGAVEVMLVWRGPDGWRRRSIPRDQMLDTTKINGLAAYGAPVSSTRSKELVDYLDAFDAANECLLPVTTICHRLGWKDGGFIMPEARWSPPGDDAPIPMHFLPPEGMDNAAAAWTQRGSFEGWCEMASLLKKKPLAWIPMYAALASPWLFLLNVPGWITDISGRTSGGKTTSLIFAASACGKPTIESPTIISSWDNTPVFIEQVCGMLQHLPMFLDETKRAKSWAVVRDVIYNFAQGQGRGRGRKHGGVNETLSWQTNLISTGESAAIAFSNDAGTRARVIQIRGRPLGEDSPENGRIAEAVSRLSAQHYGHVMPMMIDVLVQIAADPERIERLRELMAERHEIYAAQTDGSAVARRLAKDVAVMSLVADCLHGGGMFAGNGLGVPAPDHTISPFEVLIHSMRQSSAESDLPLDALLEVGSKATANSRNFWSHNRAADLEPPGGWLGIYEQGRDKLSVRSDTARLWLRELGHNPTEVVDRWVERGWLVSKTRNIVAERITNGTIQCYTLTPEAFALIHDVMLASSTKDEG